MQRLNTFFFCGFTILALYVPGELFGMCFIKFLCSLTTLCNPIDRNVLRAKKWVIDKSLSQYPPSRMYRKYPPCEINSKNCFQANPYSPTTLPLKKHCRQVGLLAFFPFPSSSPCGALTYHQSAVSNRWARWFSATFVQLTFTADSFQPLPPPLAPYD